MYKNKKIKKISSHSSHSSHKGINGRDNCDDVVTIGDDKGKNEENIRLTEQLSLEESKC